MLLGEHKKKDLKGLLIKIATRNRGRKDYGNARDLRNAFEGALEFWASRDTERFSWNLIKMEDILNWQIDNQVVLDSDVCDA